MNGLHSVFINVTHKNSLSERNFFSSYVLRCKCCTSSTHNLSIQGCIVVKRKGINHDAKKGK